MDEYIDVPSFPTYRLEGGHFLLLIFNNLPFTVSIWHPFFVFVKDPERDFSIIRPNNRTKSGQITERNPAK